MLPSKTDIEKLANDFIESDKEWEGSVIVHDIEEVKPICVFGILNTPMGLKIKDEMIGWLTDNYSVVELYHNGKCFEYPAIKLAQKLCIELNVPYTLYIHTKGAFNRSMGQQAVRNIWKQEFSTERKFLYINLVESKNPTVVTPYTSAKGHTWYNGFFCNKAAWLQRDIKKDSNRYKFERIFFERGSIKLIGVLRENIDAPEAVKVVREYMHLKNTKKHMLLSKKKLPAHDMFRR